MEMRNSDEAIASRLIEQVPIEAYEHDRQITSNRETFRLLTYSEMEALPEPQWLVDGLIQQQTAVLMFGKSNTFKSFLAVDIGLSVSSGLDWQGQHIQRRGGEGQRRRGKALFVATEGAIGLGRLRIPAWYDFHKVPHSDRSAYLYPKEIRIDVDDDVSALIEAMKVDLFDLLILDIFGGTMAGSEIEDKTARAWVHGIQRILRETGASVLTVAHTGWQDDSRARMHTHFWGSFDTRLRVEGDKANMTCTLSVERHKDADSAGQWGFRLEQTGDSLAPVLDDAVKPSRTRGITMKQRIALQALDDALEAMGEQKSGQDWPPCKVVLLDHWRDYCDRHSLADSDKPDSRKKAFQRARKDLTERGVIRMFDGYVWRCFD